MFSKYKYVYMLYKERSFSKAAQKLFISQPSLSVAIKNIEEKVGAPLFERRLGDIIPTEIGEKYIEATEKIISAENNFNNQTNDILSLKTGTLSVGGTNYFCSYVLPKIINRFTALYPSINVTLTEAKSTELNSISLEEELDLVIDSFDKIPDEFEGEELDNEKILLCVPKNSNTNKGLEKYSIKPSDILNGKIDLKTVPTISISTFKNENFVLLKPGNDMYYKAHEIFEKHNFTPKISFSVDQLSSSYALTQTGMGVCFITDTQFKHNGLLGDVLLYDVDKESHRKLFLVHRKNKYRTKAMAEFIRIAKEEFKH